RPVAAIAELGAVPGLGIRPLHRFVAALFFGEPVLTTWSFRDGALAPDPESRDSGFDASHRPGMTAILLPEALSRMSTADLAATPNELRSLAEQSNAWPFEQAKQIVARLKKRPKDEVLFETGYDPSGTHASFGEHNNARLRAFLDAFGFDYEFASSTDYYTSGKFDSALRLMLERIERVMAIMLPSLREERAASYSPFLPISPRTGEVLYVPIVAHDVKTGTISYDDPETKERVTLPVTGGHCKLQWKPDWAMRWFALGIDYEMAGKDLIDSVKLSGKICSVLGGTPPEGFNYE